MDERLERALEFGNYRKKLSKKKKKVSARMKNLQIGKQQGGEFV